MSPQALYTFVCEYSGGTYVSQTRALSEMDATNWWIGNLRTEKFIPRMSTVIAEKLRQSVDGDDDNEFYLAPLTGLTNVWQFNGTFSDEQLYVTVVVTAD